jgi:arylsulfatase A-like enzyme
MGTHGPKFDLQKQVFSAGENMGNQRSWNVDFYDDSILEFDDGIGQIIDFLKSKNLYENTIIIVSSDHDQQWGSTEQIPLLIHFPDNQFSGIRIANIQQIDVAPTLLAYMGIPKPSWMQGDSFLLGELPDRPIFSASPDKEELAAESFGLETPKPPFYQFGSISVVYCDSWLTLQLESNQYQAGLVGGLPQTCNQNPVSDDQLLAWIIQHLKETGFDTSKIDITINK